MKKNQICIVRSDKAGVFFGEVVSKVNDEVIMKNCRKIHYWDGAAAIQQLSLEGVKKPKNCRITMTVPDITILGVIEVIPCNKEAIENLNNVPVWKM